MNDKLKIGINLFTLYPGKIGGAEQYVRNVVLCISNHDDVDAYVFVNEKAYSTFTETRNVHIVKIIDGQNVDDELLFWIDYKNLDVMFCPLFFVSPHNCPIPIVPSILDIQHEFFPEYFEKDVLREIRKNTRDTLNEATGIITISEYSKRTIVDKYKVPPEKIQVTYLNSDSIFDKKLDENILKSVSDKIGSNYIFYPANTWPHKNHINLLRAYKILLDNYHIRNKLVLTGDSKQCSNDVDRFISEQNLSEHVVFLGYIDQEEMPYVYKNAGALAFPSLFEGFGIPLVEAMRIGIPIACSKCGSIPEIIQNAALFFDAQDPEDIADKIYKLLFDKKLDAELVGNGFRVCKKYSWESCTNLTLNYLRSLAPERNTAQKCENEEPLVSVITPSFNQGKYIRSTIESVLSQDYPNIEYIVMDGGSTDETVEILKSYGKRIRWVSERDNGQADAVNKGIEIANGRIIGWLNSDDTYLPHAIRKMVSFFNSHPLSDMVYGEAYYTDINGNITGRYLTEKFNKKRLAENCYICQPSAFFTKKIINQVGGLETKYQLSMDYELWMRIAKVGKISYIPEYFATSRMYEDNKTMSRRDEVFRETIAAAKKHYGYAASSWIYGYADYLCEGSRDAHFNRIYRKLFVKYNYDNLKYCFSEFEKKIKQYRDDICALKKDKDVYMGQYEDGWLSKKYVTNIMTYPCNNKLIIEGINNWPLRSKLKIQAKMNGKEIGIRIIEQKGNFVVEFPLSVGANKTNVEFALEMNKTFCPALISNSDDARRLSFILRKIEVK